MYFLRDMGWWGLEGRTLSQGSVLLWCLSARRWGLSNETINTHSEGF